MLSLNISLSFCCVCCRQQTLPGRRGFNMISQFLWKPSNRHCHQTVPSKTSVHVPPIQRSAHLSHLDCDLQQQRRGECMPHFPWKGFFPNPQSMIFTDLQQKQSCDSRRELISINGVWGWGKTRPFVTWKFWGVPLSQDQYCGSHKCLCHAALPLTKTCIIFLSFFQVSFLLISEAFTNLTPSYQSKLLMEFGLGERGVGREVDCFREENYSLLSPITALYFPPGKKYIGLEENNIK